VCTSFYVCRSTSYDNIYHFGTNTVSFLLSLFALCGRFMTVSSAIRSCLQLPSLSPCRSCWWRRLAFVAVFFLLLFYPTFCLLLYHVSKIHVSKCVQSIRVFTVVLCLKYSCFSALSGELIHLLLCLPSWSFPFSTKPTFQKLLFSLCQP